MLYEELVFVGTCDIAGHVRGKGFPVQEIEPRRRKGIGWTHSNLMQTAFGPILDTPFGTAGDLMIVPDPEAEVRVDFADGSALEPFVGSAVPTGATYRRPAPNWMLLLEPPAASPKGTVYLRYGLAEGTPASRMVAVARTCKYRGRS